MFVIRLVSLNMSFFNGNEVSSRKENIRRMCLATYDYGQGYRYYNSRKKMFVLEKVIT